MKMRNREQKIKPADDATPVSPPAEDTAPVTKNVTCSYGIHRGNFPVAGMKVKDARAVLKKLIKVDDGAAAVINGRIVEDEEEIISSEVTMLSFVKPSAVKGSETITLSDELVEGVGKKFKVDQFCDLISKNTVSGLTPDPIPDNVKWVVRAGKLEVYILELKPELRRIKWIAEGGAKGVDADSKAGNGYQFRQLATPYIVMAVPFYGGQLHPALELFYRNEPLSSLDDKLCHCNLLNVSMGKAVEGRVGFKTWVCTQYLDVSKCKTNADTLSEIINHLFGGGFNRSSDHNEGASGFSTYEAEQKADPRTKNVDLWEKASQEDPRFVLDTKWIPAKATPRDLIQFRMNEFKATAAPTNTKAIGNLLLAANQVAF